MKITSKRKKQLENPIVHVLAKIPRSLHKELKAEAALSSRKINDVLLEAVKEWVARQHLLDNTVAMLTGKGRK